MDFGSQFALDKVRDAGCVDEGSVGEVDVKVEGGVRFCAVTGCQDADFSRTQIVARERFATSEQNEAENPILEFSPVLRLVLGFVVRVDVENEGDGAARSAEHGVDRRDQQKIRIVEILAGDAAELHVSRFTVVRRNSVRSVLPDDF